METLKRMTKIYSNRLLHFNVPIDFKMTGFKSDVDTLDRLALLNTSILNHTRSFFSLHLILGIEIKDFNFS